MPSRASTSSPRLRPAPARRSPSGFRSSSAPPAPTGRPAALVLVPTRELASQVVEDIRPLAAVKGLRIAAVYGGTSLGAAGQARPGRAHPRRHTGPALRPDRAAHDLARRAVRVLVLDEADRMLDMGFRPQVDRILRRRSREPADDAVLRDARRAGRRARPRIHVQPVPLPRRAPAEASAERSTTHSSPVTAEDKLERLVEQLDGERGLALVFVRTKHGADKLARKLANQHDVRAAVMHGNMSQNARERVAGPVRVGPRLDARRHRRRRPRARRRRRHARDQLRSAALATTTTSTASAAPAAQAAAARRHARAARAARTSAASHSASGTVRRSPPRA